MSSRRSPVQVFAIDDTSLQLTWRGLRPGDLRITAADAVVTAEVVGPGPGVATLTDLPPGTDLEVRTTGSALVEAAVIPVRTDDRLPGEELVRVATVSDLHLGAEVFGHLGTIREEPRPSVPHPVRCAKAAVDEAAAWGARRILAKGDLTNHGRVPEWRHYADLVRLSPVPVDAAPGNHDRAFRFGGSGLAPEDAARTFDLSMATPLLVRDEPGLRIVLADTTTRHRNRGQIVRVQHDIVAAAADAPAGSAVLVGLHHQIHREPTPEGYPVGIGQLEGRRFLAALGATGHPTLVTSGHTHRHRRWSHAGVTVTQVGSTKDYPGVWAGYVVHEGGMRQVVRRITAPDCLAWTDHTRRAALGAWRWVAPGYLSSRCFSVHWDRP